MDSTLEEGYLTRMFNEPIYLMGCETLKEKASITANIQLETIPVKQEIKKIPVTPSLQVLQETPQKIARKCLLVFESEEDELKAHELAFLASIMKACNVLPGEYECINFRGITINDLASRYSYNKLVLFGVTIPGLVIGQYKNTQVKSTQIISADATWMLESNVNLKKQLWGQLQLMFGLIK